MHNTSKLIIISGIVCSMFFVGWSGLAYILGVDITIYVAVFLIVIVLSITHIGSFLCGLIPVAPTK